MTEVKMRRMNPNDFEAVAQLCAQLGYPTDIEKTEQRFIKINTDFKQTVFVAETVDQKVIGFIHAKESMSLLKDLCVEICALVVDQNYRGARVGSRLMEHIEAWANERKLYSIQFTSRATRTDAHRLYQRLGYEITKTSHWFVKQL